MADHPFDGFGSRVIECRNAVENNRANGSEVAEQTASNQLGKDLIGETLMDTARFKKQGSDRYDLITYRKRINSQYGEDGILSKILNELFIEKGAFLEFGAGDGVTLSNTKLLADMGWQGVCIEADEGRYENLEDIHRNNPAIHTINCHVRVNGENAIDNLLRKTNVPFDFDVASIDIDGNDYLIWESMIDYKPKIVLIETNFSFPFNLEFVQKEDAHIGSSAVAMYYLGLKKGYSFVCYNFINCFFVRNDLAPLLRLKNGAFAYLYSIGVQNGATGFVVSDYEGVWHSIFNGLNVWGKNNKIQVRGTNDMLLANASKFRHIQDPNEIATLFEQN